MRFGVWCFFVLGVVFCAGEVRAQNKIDSLLAMLPGTKGEVRYAIVYDLVFEYMEIDDAEGLRYAEEAYRLADTFADSTKIMKSGWVRASLLNRLSRYKEAIDLLHSLLPSIRKSNDPNMVKYVLNSLANAYTLQGNYTKGLVYHFESLTIRTQQKDSLGMSFLLSDIGILYYKVKDIDKALEYYKRALDLRLQLKNKDDLDRLYVNISLCYYDLKQYTASEMFATKGLQVCGEHCSDPIRIEGELALGLAKSGLRQYSAAKQHLGLSYSLATKLKDTRFMADGLINLAEVYDKENDYERAISFLLKAISIAKENNYQQSLLEAYGNIVDVYQFLNNYGETTKYRELYIELQRKIFNDELAASVARFEADLEEFKYLQTIENQREVLRIQAMALQRGKYLVGAIGVIAVLLVLIAVLLYRRNMRRRKLNDMLEGLVAERTKELVVKQEGLYAGGLGRMPRGPGGSFVFSTTMGNLPVTQPLPMVLELKVTDVHGRVYADKGDFRKVSDQELAENGIDAHGLKYEYLGKGTQVAHFDLFVDKITNELWIFKKGLVGDGMPTGIILE